MKLTWLVMNVELDETLVSCKAQAVQRAAKEMANVRFFYNGKEYIACWDDLVSCCKEEVVTR